MTLRVLEPGLYTLLVDRGRPGYRGLGVPVGGAADRSALALGNALVGNPPDSAALEITLAGPTVQAGRALGCVLYGARFMLSSDRQTLAAGKTFTLEPGEVLQVGGAWAGARAYLCVRGGFRAPVILGSRSSLAPLRAGAELGCESSSVPARFVQPAPAWNRHPHTLRVVDGPQADWFQPDAFYPRAFRVGPSSDRMGTRLAGEPVTPTGRELVSEPACPGSVQVTHDGQCIVLGVDGQTIGGYPKVAQVISADLDKLGQLRAGDGVRFVRVSLAEAALLHRWKRAELNGWLVRLRATWGA
jgi:biotin-dependent carboxylase-like uncharacterized protein